VNTVTGTISNICYTVVAWIPFLLVGAVLLLAAYGGVTSVQSSIGGSGFSIGTAQPNTTPVYVETTSQRAPRANPTPAAQSSSSVDQYPNGVSSVG
jgi:hypothetical protein